MHMLFERRLPSADEIKEQFPLSEALKQNKIIRELVRQQEQDRKNQ